MGRQGSRGSRSSASSSKYSSSSSGNTSFSSSTTKSRILFVDPEADIVHISRRIGGIDMNGDGVMCKTKYSVEDHPIQVIRKGKTKTVGMERLPVVSKKLAFVRKRHHRRDSDDGYRHHRHHHHPAGRSGSKNYSKYDYSSDSDSCEPPTPHGRPVRINTARKDDDPWNRESHNHHDRNRHHHHRHHHHGHHGHPHAEIAEEDAYGQRQFPKGSPVPPRPPRFPQQSPQPPPPQNFPSQNFPPQNFPPQNFPPQNFPPQNFHPQ